MPDYKEMYCKLCRAQAKLDYLFEEARAIICEVQQVTEQIYLESKDPVVLPAISKGEQKDGKLAILHSDKKVANPKDM